MKELEPFIIAGKFADWKLPAEVLQEGLIKYYKSPKAEHRYKNFEKVIVNLNLSLCPTAVINELISFCEEHYLTTALIFL
jgi:hypothetical protein